jgi:protein-tyrosine phosphatase
MLSVDARWLQAGFDEIDARWGSFDAYVRDGLALTATDIQTLRRHLLAGAG